MSLEGEITQKKKNNSWGRLVILTLVALHFILLLTGVIQKVNGVDTDGLKGFAIEGCIFNVIEFGLLALFMLKKKVKPFKIVSIVFLVICALLSIMWIGTMISNLEDLNEGSFSWFLAEVCNVVVLFSLMFKKVREPFFESRFSGVFDPVIGLVSSLTSTLSEKISIPGENETLKKERTLVFAFILAAWLSDLISWTFWAFSGDDASAGEIIKFIVSNLVTDAVIFGPFIIQTFVKGKSPEENWWWLLVDGIIDIAATIWGYREFKKLLGGYNHNVGQFNSALANSGISERVSKESIPAGMYFYVAFGVIAGIFCILAAIRLLKNKKLLKENTTE